jgi:hypothetical protein
MAFHLAQLMGHNALADQSPGFGRRLQTESGTGVHPWSEDPFALVNMLAWKSPKDPKEFVYRSSHLDDYFQRSDWLDKSAQVHCLPWSAPQGHIPTLEEARGRLEHYRAKGASPREFWFGKLFPAPPVEVARV